MAEAAAKQNDLITAQDTHIIMVPSESGEKPVPTAGHQFNGIINGGLSTNVTIMGQPAAIKGSTADNTPPHIPLVPGRFQQEPSNKGTIKAGSGTVFINGEPAARNGDLAETCDDLGAVQGKVEAVGTVYIGG
jgi:uncharacterized Zn-binding protein involved in type VI secretion